MTRPWWVRVLIVIPLLAIALVGGFIVALGLGGVGCCTGYDHVYVYAEPDPDDPGAESVSEVIDEYYVPPAGVGAWLIAAAIELGALAITLAALWAAWMRIRNPRAKERRWSPVSRGFVWTFVLLTAVFAVFALATHWANWTEWHALLSSDPSIPHEAQPGQIPAGVVAFLAVPATFAALALLLRARGRL